MVRVGLLLLLLVGSGGAVQAEEAPGEVVEKPAVKEPVAPVDWVPFYFEDEENPDLPTAICEILTRHDVNWIGSSTRKHLLILVPRDQLDKAKAIIRRNKAFRDLVFQDEKPGAKAE